MKKWLILILLVAVAAGAHLSRPGHENFERFIAEPDRTIELPGGVRVQFDPPATGPQYIFHDRYVFTTIEQEGQTRYVGAFGQWFRWGEPPAEAQETPAGETEQAPDPFA